MPHVAPLFGKVSFTRIAASAIPEAKLAMLDNLRLNYTVHAERTHLFMQSVSILQIFEHINIITTTMTYETIKRKKINKKKLKIDQKTPTSIMHTYHLYYIF